MKMAAFCLEIVFWATTTQFGIRVWFEPNKRGRKHGHMIPKGFERTKNKISCLYKKPQSSIQRLLGESGGDVSQVHLAIFIDNCQFDETGAR